MPANESIIEHPTRGVLTDLPGDRDEKPHFAWSILRSDERVRRFKTITAAEVMLPILPHGCYVLQVSGGKDGPYTKVRPR